MFHFDGYFSDINGGNSEDCGFLYFPDAMKIFDWKERNLKSNHMYKIMYYDITGCPVIKLEDATIFEVDEMELPYIKIVDYNNNVKSNAQLWETIDTDLLDGSLEGEIKKNQISNVTERDIEKYMQFVEGLWLDQAIDISLKNKNEEAFNRLVLIKYPEGKTNVSQA